MCVVKKTMTVEVQIKRIDAERNVNIKHKDFPQSMPS
jgi:hypothetical protein